MQDITTLGHKNLCTKQALKFKSKAFWGERRVPDMPDDEYHNYSDTVHELPIELYVIE